MSIIETENREKGLINVRDIDYASGSGEPGIFIWDDNYFNYTVSFRSVLCLIDFCFEDLCIRKLVIHVLSDNRRAIQLNIAFGFVLSLSQENVYNQEYTLFPDTYKVIKSKLFKFIK